MEYGAENDTVYNIDYSIDYSTKYSRDINVQESKELCIVYLIEYNLV